MKDTIKLKGVLTLKAYKKGVLQWVKSDNNLIVTNGYLAMFNALIGTANKYITKVQIGTNGVAAVASNTAITSPVDLTIDSTTIVSNKLTFSFSMDDSTGNGTTFAEFGLILADGGLFSRKAWTPFEKIADLTINGTWEINL